MALRSPRPAVTALVAALALAACGSQTATKQDVIAQANAICAGAQRDVRAVPPPSGVNSFGDLAAYLRQVVPVVTREAVSLQALPRPARSRAVLERYLASVRADSAQYQALARAAKAGDRSGVEAALGTLQNSTAPALAQRYGLRQCAADLGTAVR